MKTPKLKEQTKYTLADKVDRLGNFIGNTPLFPISNLNPNKNVTIYAKLEWQQLGSSVKSRPAYQIIYDAIQRKELTRGKHLLDASSGNTGIAYAHIAAHLGISMTLCLPENASDERKDILKSLGVNLHLTSRSGGTDEAQKVAESLYKNNPKKYYYADQYSNPSNWKAHYHTTGPEIIEQTEGCITHFIAGLGTTGTFCGTGKQLKEFNPEIQLTALQPDIAMHGLEGWKHLETAIVPDIYDDTLPNEIREVSTESAYELIPKTARNEGLLLSPSAAANLVGALQLAEEIDEGTIVTIFPDDGSKYGETLTQIK